MRSQQIDYYSIQCNCNKKAGKQINNLEIFHHFNRYANIIQNLNENHNLY